MKKIFISLLSVFVLGAVFCNVASAQTVESISYTVATVNIYNSKIVSSNDRNYKISFDLSNDSGVQSQIRYSVQLTKTVSSSSDVVVDEKIYDPIFSIDEKTTIPQSVVYSIPSSLGKGDYKLWVYSKNNNGLILAAAYVGEIKLTTDLPNTVEIIPESCYVTIKNNANSSKYYLGDLASIVSKDSLVMNCSVSNRYTSDVSLVPLFETRVRSMYGETVSQIEGTQGTITIKKGKNNIEVALPKALVPQTYVNVFSLVSDDKKISTNNIITTYSLEGESGSIMNAVFDKTSYKKGEIANVKIFSMLELSGSTSTASTASISVSVTNQENRLCSEVIKKDASTAPVVEIPVPVIEDCVNPKANIILSSTNTNGENLALDTQSFDVTTPKKDIPIDYKQIAIASVIFILLIIILTIIYRRKNVSVIKVLALFIICAGFMLGMTNKAEALTEYIKYQTSNKSDDNCYYNMADCYMNFTYNLNKASTDFYLPGESIIVTGIVGGGKADTPSLNPAGRQYHTVYMKDLKIDSSSDQRILVQSDVQGPWDKCSDNWNRSFPNKTGTQTFTAPSTPGVHNMNVTYYNNFSWLSYGLFCITGQTQNSTNIFATRSLPFTVKDIITPTYSLDFHLSKDPSYIGEVEGNTVTVSLYTTNVSNGTLVPYTITGVSQADIGVPLSGHFTAVTNNYYSELQIPILTDNITEGQEKLVLSVGNTQGGFTILDKIVVSADISANPNPVLAGSSSTISWTSTGFDSCTMTNENTGSLLNNLSWTSIPNAVGYVSKAITYGNGLFVAVEDNHYINPIRGAIMTSPDGLTWTARTSPTTNVLYSVAYGNGRFVAVGVGNKIITSTNGIDWVATPGPIEQTSTTWVSVTYGPLLWVAIGGAGQSMTSSDGLTWKSQGNGMRYGLEAVIYGAGFVAVGEGGVQTSLNGLNWTTQTPAVSAHWNSVAYSPTGTVRYVAVSYGGKIMTAPVSGNVWTLRNTPVTFDPSDLGTNYLSSVIYAGGKFIASGQISSGDSITLVSTDGINWSNFPGLTPDHCFNQLAYGNNSIVGVGCNTLTTGVATTKFGSISSGNLTIPTTFSIHCTNSTGGVRDDSVEVGISGPESPIIGSEGRTIATTTEGNEIAWTALPDDKCTLSKNDGASIDLPGAAGGTIDVLDTERATGMKYDMVCMNDSIPYGVQLIVPGICAHSQGGDTANVYVNRNTIWTNLGMSGSTVWSGTNIAGTPNVNPLNKIYTTVGPKSIHAETTVGGKVVSRCDANFTVKLDKGTNTEI
ncbi:MAG: hypothetical protein WC933_00135 [Candidatus Paceibacterota bacterium]|jgi:hypothetical protein